MPEKRSPGRGRRPAAPPRDILAGKVRADELPDVVRPAAPGATEQEAITDATVSASTNAARVNVLARSVLEVGRVPLRVTEAVLESEAVAIEDWVARGAVPTVLVPGALVLKAQMRLLAGVVRVVSGPHSSRTSEPG